MSHSTNNNNRVVNAATNEGHRVYDDQMEEYRQLQRDRYMRLMDGALAIQRQTGQILQNTPARAREEVLHTEHGNNGNTRRVQGTATTVNRPVDYSTHIPSAPSILPSNNNEQHAHQLAQDEELARRLQREELEQARHEEQSQSMPLRYNAGFFHPSLRGQNIARDEDQVDEDYEVLPYAQSEMYETDDPEDLIRNIFPPIRTIVPQQEHPINQFLRNLLVSARTNQDLRDLPRQRIVFPQQFFQIQGFDSVPPHLREMLHGDSDTSYERLLELSEALQPVSRGADAERIASLPSRQFHQNNDVTSSEQQSTSTTCNICLDDFKESEVITTLPQCLHSFHKTCISKWLAINKVCPVCRADTTEAVHA